MKHLTDSPETFESTYALIVRSEEKERSASEGAVYVLIMLSALFSIWQATHQPITLPLDGIIHTAAIVQSHVTQPAHV